jgi:hypothetical protein
MKDMRKLAITVIGVGLLSLLIGVICKLMVFDVLDEFGPRSFSVFTVICFLLSINFLLLDKKS